LRGERSDAIEGVDDDDAESRAPSAAGRRLARTRGVARGEFETLDAIVDRETNGISRYVETNAHARTSFEGVAGVTRVRMVTHAEGLTTTAGADASGRARGMDKRAYEARKTRT